MKKCSIVPFEVDGEWGYYDSAEERVVCEPQWGWCGHFVPDAEVGMVARFNADIYSPICSEEIEEECFQETWVIFYIAIGEPDPGQDVVKERDGFWGLVSQEGEEIIESIYEYLSPIRDGIMLARTDKKWGVVDTCGRVVIPCEYEDICFAKAGGVVTCRTVDGEKRYMMWNSKGEVLKENLPEAAEWKSVY